MYRLVAALLLTALSSAVNAQANFGLVCSSQNEPVPRLLKINGQQLRGFDYGGQTWFTFSSPSVDADKIEGWRNTGTGTFNNRFSVNRINGTWSSRTDMNYKDSESASGICVRKTDGEMDALASDYLAQLNNRRAF
jgi:hypothetical protein